MTFFTGIGDISVFLVEPSNVQAQFIQARLGELGVQRIRIYHEGATALAAMPEFPPDLVISSMYLKDMTGAQLIEKIRADEVRNDVAFILVSSETNHRYLDPVRQAGASAILPKPFEMRQLKTALSATLDYLNPGNNQMMVENVDIEGLHVLLVDDSRTARSFIRHVLENLGISHIIEAENGRQAAEIIQAQYFDLVVTDYNMPEMDGKELVEFIRGKSWQSSVPVLMVSSERDQNRLAAVEQAGVSAVCDKPFEPALVKSLLEKMLAARD
jgi:two-component system, chemotaxis family, chemotaxis protein CheY